GRPAISSALASGGAGMRRTPNKKNQAMIIANKTLRIALAQLNFRLGDFDRTVAQIEASVARARAEGADLVVFSECALSGYLPGDMIARPEFLARQFAVLNQVAALSDDALGIVVGFVALNPASYGKRLQNAAALCHGGALVGTVA